MIKIRYQKKISTRMSVRNYLLSLKTLRLAYYNWERNVFEFWSVSAFFQPGLISNSFLADLH